MEARRKEIVEELAKQRRVEQIIDNICRPCTDTASLADLAQMVYLILLECSAEKVCDLWDKGQINFFLVRIVINQYRSKNSPYYHALREFSARSTEITERNGGVDNGED